MVLRPPRPSAPAAAAACSAANATCAAPAGSGEPVRPLSLADWIAGQRAAFGPTPSRSGHRRRRRGDVGPVLPPPGLFASWLDRFVQLFRTTRAGKAVLLILQDMMEQLHQFFLHPKDTLRELTHLDHREKQMRSELRFACELILICLLQHYDLATGRIGFPAPDGMVYWITMKKLARMTGLALRRVYRAMRALRRAGLVTVTRQFRKDGDGSIINLPAIRTLSPLLFDRFGLGESRERQQHDAHLRQQKANAEHFKNARPTRRETSHVKLPLAGLLARIRENSDARLRAKRAEQAKGEPAVRRRKEDAPRD